jgi:serine/threonine protein phosphatase PrpC
MIIVCDIIYLNELGGRENLEDAIYPPPGTAEEGDKLFLVCDGVGGENKGEVASHIASTEFPVFFDAFPPGEGFDADTYLSRAQNHVLGEMRKYAEAHPDAIKMSTTLTLAYVTKKGVLTAWCGDSRIYHIRNGNILWQSIDHSLVAKLVEQGEITEHEAINHAQRNIIIRSLSASGKTADIDTKWLTDIRDNDYIMLCTDGVLENLNDARIEEILTNIQDDKKTLFLNYSLGKTRDNFSLYLFKLVNQKTAEETKYATPVSPQKSKKPFPLLLFIIIVLIVAAGAYLVLNIRYFNIGGIFKSNTDTVKTEPVVMPRANKNDTPKTIAPALPKPDTVKNKKPIK